MSGDAERLRRWRLVLGGGEAAEGTGVSLGEVDARMDGALGALYDERDRKAGWAPPRRTWRAGWATSAPTFPPASCA